MGYAFIPLIASVLLGLRYLVVSEASSWSKIVVSSLVVLGAVLFLRLPQLLLVATLLQVAVSIYVLLYLKLHEDT